MSMNQPLLHNNRGFGAQVKCFSQQAALCAEITRLQQSGRELPTINLEVAPRQGETVNWGQKIVLQLSDKELPELCAVLLGYLPSLHLKRPGKGIEVIRQSHKLFIRASQGSGRLYVLPVGMGDTFRLNALLLSALKQQSGLQDETLILAALRGAFTLAQLA